MGPACQAISHCPLLRWPRCARKSHGRGLCLINGKASCRLAHFWFWEVLGFVWGRAKISAKKYMLFINSYRACMRYAVVGYGLKKEAL
jgi:hypothetical protein